jgi:hypothetical protein
MLEGRIQRWSEMSKQFPGVDIDAVHGGRMTATADDNNIAKVLADEIEGEIRDPHTLDPFLQRVQLALTVKQWEAIVKALRSERYVQGRVCLRTWADMSICSCREDECAEGIERAPISWGRLA